MESLEKIIYLLSSLNSESMFCPYIFVHWNFQLKFGFSIVHIGGSQVMLFRLILLLQMKLVFIIAKIADPDFIWVFTVCQVPIYGFPGFSDLLFGKWKLLPRSF